MVHGGIGSGEAAMSMWGEEVVSNAVQKFHWPALNYHVSNFNNDGLPGFASFLSFTLALVPSSSLPPIPSEIPYGHVR